MPRGKLPKGICSVCEKERAALADGTMRRHRGHILAKIDPVTGDCLGSRKPPTQVTKDPEWETEPRRNQIVGEGTCPTCKQRKPVLRDGDDIVMRKHYAAFLEHQDADGRCLGSGQPPTAFMAASSVKSPRDTEGSQGTA